MIISYNWLKEYLDISLSPQQLGEKLTLLGFEVTEIKTVNSSITGLVVGEVLKKWKHPNADRLNLTHIRHWQKGTEVVSQVVCGADNIAIGQKIFLATVGTELAPGFVIKKAKIRGKESCGMVCSREELGKEEKSEGIWVLPADTPLDTNPQKLLGQTDYLLDFDITSNRWDCMSVWGVVREIAILLKSSCTYKNRGSFSVWEKMEEIDFEKLPSNSRIKIVIENPSDCYRYQGLDIVDIKINESPEWLANRLFLHGLRPIKNVVDVTNLILREYGQPIHAFDADKIGKEIHIRRARKGEQLVLLDGKKIQLTVDDLVIADEKFPIALAGIMGGIETGVTVETKNVLLETAVFNPKLIHNTTNRHQLDSEASRYFRHRVDTIFSQEVIRIAGAWIAHLTQGRIPYQIVDLFPNRKKFSTSKKIDLTIKLLHQILGFELSQEEVTSILTQLQFSPLQWEGQGKSAFVTVTVPSYRHDLEYEWDLIEEIARVYGYDNIPITYPRITNGFGHLFKSPDKIKDKLQQRLRDICLSLGFHEVLTYPFIENQFAEQLKMDEKDFMKPLNPVWSDISLLRNNLLFGFLKTIQRNTEKKVSGFNKIFEINKIFSPFPSLEKENNNMESNSKNSSLYEHSHLALALWEGENNLHWKYPHNREDFFQLSGVVEEIFKQIFHDCKELYFYPQIGKNNLSMSLKNVFTPGVIGQVMFQNKEVGIVGLISDMVKNYFGLHSDTIKKNIFYAEMNLDILLGLVSYHEVDFKDFSIYPAIKRDLALVLDKDVSIQNILKELPKHSPLLSQVNLTSIYEGENISTGKKSVVFNLEFTAFDKTLEKIEADQEVLLIVEKLKKNHSFSLR